MPELLERKAEPVSKKIPDRPVMETEVFQEREKRVHEAIQSTEEQQALLDELVDEGGLTSKTYREEVEALRAGLQEEFPASQAIQEGMQAIISLDEMLADHFLLKQSQKQRNADRKFQNMNPDEQAAIKRLAQWQQYAVNFLVGHMALQERSQQPESVHQQFLSALQKRVSYNQSLKTSPARQTIQEVFGHAPSAEDLRDALEQRWEGTLAMAALTHVLASTGYQVRWADADHDVLNAIDVLAKDQYQRLFAIQLKARRNIPHSVIFRADEWEKFSSDPRHMAEMQHLNAGVQRFNRQEGESATGLLAYLRYDPSRIDTTTGFVSAETRDKLRMLIEQAIAS